MRVGYLLQRLPARVRHTAHVHRVETPLFGFVKQEIRCRRLADAARADLPAGFGQPGLFRRLEDVAQQSELALLARIALGR